MIEKDLVLKMIEDKISLIENKRRLNGTKLIVDTIDVVALKELYFDIFNMSNGNEKGEHSE